MFHFFSLLGLEGWAVGCLVPFPLLPIRSPNSSFSLRTAASYRWQYEPSKGGSLPEALTSHDGSKGGMIPLFPPPPLPSLPLAAGNDRFIMRRISTLSSSWSSTIVKLECFAQVGWGNTHFVSLVFAPLSNRAEQSEGSCIRKVRCDRDISDPQQIRRMSQSSTYSVTWATSPVRIGYVIRLLR